MAHEVKSYVADLGADVTKPAVDGGEAGALTVDLDPLAAAESSDVLRSLPAFDP
jgi:hypothetical protein